MRAASAQITIRPYASRTKPAKKAPRHWSVYALMMGYYGLLVAAAISPVLLR
jgi:hypothetical protein